MPGMHPEADQNNGGNAVVTEQKPVFYELNALMPHHPDGIGAIKPQDMYVAPRGRGVQHTYPTEEEKDPNNPPPGCPCDKETWKISYEDTVETTKKTHPEWAPRQVKVEAALRFRPRYRSDKASIKQEKSGERTYDADLTFTMTDDGVFKYTSGPYAGWMIEDFSLREKRLTPDKYSLRDHQTSLAIQEALNNGEKSNNKKTTVVTSYYREGEDNRDILVMEYNHEIKTGTIRVVSTEKEGKYHDFSTVAAIAKQEFPNFYETRPAEGIFLLTDSAVSEKQIRSAILRAESDTTDANILHQSVRADDGPEGIESKGEPDVVVEQAVSLPSQNKTMRVSDVIVGDSLRTADYARRSLQQEFKMLTTTLRLNADQKMPKKPVVLPPFLQRLLGISEKKESRKEEKKNTEFHEERDHEISDQQSQEPLKELQEAWEVVTGAKEIIRFAVEPQTQGVAIPAAIFALDIFAHPELTLIEDAQEGIEEDAVVSLTEKEWEAVVAFITSDDEEIPFFESTQEIEKASKIEYIDMTVLMWVKELIQRIDHEPLEKAIETIEHEQEVTLLQVSELREVFLQMDGERRLKSAITNSNSELQFAPGKEDVKVNEREHVEDFSFAFTIWLLLKLDGNYRSLQSLKTFLTKEPKQGSIIEKLKERMPEGLVQGEPSQWILLAIIWYLAMIREQGLPISNIKYQISKTQSKKSKKKYKTQLSQSAVIFAYTH